MLTQLVSIEQRESYLKVRHHGGFLYIKNPYGRFISNELFGLIKRKNGEIYLLLGTEPTYIRANDEVYGPFFHKLPATKLGKMTVYGDINGYKRILESFQRLVREGLKVFIHPSPGWPAEVIVAFQQYIYWNNGKGEVIHITDGYPFSGFVPAHEIGHHIYRHLSPEKREEIKMRWYEIMQRDPRAILLNERFAFEEMIDFPLGKVEDDPEEMFASAVNAAALAPKGSVAYQLARRILAGVVDDIPRVRE